MTSYLSRLSPVPGFPSYTGPHKVGSIDVEIPATNLDSPSPSPSNNINTIQYRIFYPCEPDAKGKSISWIPAPQRSHISAYSRFLGAGNYLAEIVSYVLLRWIEKCLLTLSGSSLEFSITYPFLSSKMPLFLLHKLRISGGQL